MGNRREAPTTSDGAVFGPRRTRRRAAAVVALIAIGLSACGAGDDPATRAIDAAPAETPNAEGGDLAIGSGESEQVGDVPATAGSSATGAPLDNFGRDLVVVAGVTMITPNVGQAVDDVLDIALRNGGAIYNADVTIDDPLDDGSVPGRGTIVIRIPPTQLDDLIDDLRGVGTLRNQTQSVDDVTEQLIDLDMQIRQASESVERMEAILAETTDFDGLVAAETELVRRQTAYERLLAAQRNVDDRVALSKLTVAIQYQAPGTEPAPIVEQGNPGIGDAFADGWSAFIGLLFGFAFVLAVTAPFIAVGLVIGGVTWVTVQRIQRRQDIKRNRHEPLDDVPAPWPGPAGDDAVNAPDGELVDANRNE